MISARSSAMAFNRWADRDHRRGQSENENAADSHRCRLAEFSSRVYRESVASDLLGRDVVF